MKEVLVFDVNETLLDLKALRPLFGRLLGDEAILGQWFALLLRGSFAATILNHYHDFGVIAADALAMLAQQTGTTLTPADTEAIGQAMRRLPPHPDVPGGLERLQQAGFRLAALTNSPPEIAQAQMQNAGLASYFEQTLSVHPTGRFKPAPEPYHYAARQLGIAPVEMRMIAAHDWDVAGALSAGCRAAFVARPGMVMGALLPRPDITGRDLHEIADQLIP